MTTQLKITSENFVLVGDGVATEARLSVYNFPFVYVPGLTPTGFVEGGLGNRIASMALQGMEVVITFTAPFTGEASGANCALLFDLPA